MIKELMEDMSRIVENRVDQNASDQMFDHLGNLTVSQLDYLAVVRDQEKVTSSDIAKALGYANSSVTVMIKRLIKMGLLTKSQSSEDKRVSYVELTELGQNVVQIQLRVFRDIAGALESQLTQEEQETFAKLLRKGLEGLNT